MLESRDLDLFGKGSLYQFICSASTIWGRISLPSELCDLDKDLDIHAKNYHFAEIYKENRILFDYKLKEGRCTTTNARYLLRMAGILK